VQRKKPEVERIEPTLEEVAAEDFSEDDLIDVPEDPADLPPAPMSDDGAAEGGQPGETEGGSSVPPDEVMTDPAVDAPETGSQ
tara:strand:- start:532 stop:780 length:249 start_codon:yes stop_codon:yes gene_type:complete